MSILLSAGRAGRSSSSGDWFAQLFGCKESATLAKSKNDFVIEGPDEKGHRRLRSSFNDTSYSVGKFSTPSLQELEARRISQAQSAPISVITATSDVSEYHAMKENKHATFQVASQFNCLEFPSPSITPEAGVTDYFLDRTQGPACSIACGPATVFRNYYVCMDSENHELSLAEGTDAMVGQTFNRQINNLAGISRALGNEPEGRFFEVQNGYVFSKNDKLVSLNRAIAENDAEEIGKHLRVGLHEEVQVTSARWGAVPQPDPAHTVTQVFGSAISVAYSQNSASLWEPLGRIVLRASYLATLHIAAEAAARHEGKFGSRKVFLTLLGGGVFGNPLEWIIDAIRDACEAFKDSGLEVVIVSYGGVDPMVQSLCDEFKNSD